MENKKMICIVCPIGCHLEVMMDSKSETGYIVKGARCDKGKVYGVKIGL